MRWFKVVASFHHPSGYHVKKTQPKSKHAVIPNRKLTLDMRDLGERCGKHRVARLLKGEGLRSQTGYGRKPVMPGGKPAVVAPNHLQRQFNVAEPNQPWVTDITYRNAVAIHTLV